MFNEEDEFVWMEEDEVGGLYSLDPAVLDIRFCIFLRWYWLSLSSLHFVPLDTLTMAEKSEEVISLSRISFLLIKRQLMFSSLLPFWMTSLAFVRVVQKVMIFSTSFSFESFRPVDGSVLRTMSAVSFLRCELMYSMEDCDTSRKGIGRFRVSKYVDIGQFFSVSMQLFPSFLSVN